MPGPSISPAAASRDGADEERFLVHRDMGELVMRSSADSSKVVLVAHADGALYDAALELVWFRDGELLKVLDLRATDMRSVTVARSLPELRRFSIARADHLVATEDNCDLAEISLEWTQTPSAQSVLSGMPELPIIDAAWLRAQLGRPLRKVGDRREFGRPLLRLPKARLACEDPEVCGTTVRFGPHGWQLVQVLEKMGGDCWDRACLLHDPATGRFATPPAPAGWAAAEQTRNGSCGLYMFNRAQSAFLHQRSLCTSQHCSGLDGLALGWLVPGDIVGAPGILPE